MKRIFRNLIAATMLMAGFATIGVGCTNYDDDIAHLQDQIDDLKGTDIDHVKTLNDLAALTQSLSQQASDIQSQLNAQKSAYDKEISDLKTALQNLQNNTATKAELQALQSQYNSLKGDVDDLKAFKTTIEGRVATLEGKVAELEAKMKAAEQIFQEWADFSELWFGTEENGWKGFYNQLQSAMGRVENWDKAAEFLAEYQFDMENWFGKYDEDGEWQPGLMKFVEDFIIKNGELDYAVLTDTIVELTEQVADLEAILSDLGDDSLADYIKNQVDGILGDTTLADFYDKYEKLQETVFGKDVNWEAQAEWLKSTGNDSYADIIQSIYKDIEELNSLVSAVSEAENKIKTAIENVIEQQLQDGGSINKAIAAATSDLAGILAKIEEIERIQKEQQQAIADLIDRIQSLVYVPEYSDGNIHIGGLAIQYTNAEGKLTTIMLSSEEEDVETTLTYRVSPAELAKTLAEKADWKFYANTVKRTRAITPADVEIETIKYAGTDADAGLIEFTISTTHTFETEDLAIALCVSLPGSNDEVEGDNGEDNGEVEEGEDTPETRAEDSTLTVKTEFTSPYTIVVAEPQIINKRFVFAKLVDVTEIEEGGENTGDCKCEGECFCDDACKNGTVEGDDEGEEGEGEEEETPAEPVYEWRTYFGVYGTTALAQWNSAHTVQYYKTESQIYADLKNPYEFFEGFEVVYYDPKTETFHTLAEMEGKWNIDLAWGFTHLDGQAKVNDPALGTKDTDYKLDNSAANGNVAQPYHSIERINGIEQGLKSNNGSSYAATDRINLFLYEKGKFDGEHFVVDDEQYNNFYYVVRDVLNVKASAEPLIWNYTNWSQFFTANAGGDYTVKVKFTGLNKNQVAAITGDTTAEWTVIPCKEDAFITFNEEDGITATVAADDADELTAVFTIKDFAYAHGTKNTLTLKATTKGETSQVAVIVSVPVVTPAEKALDPFAAPMQWVTSTTTDYLRYTLFAGEAQAVDGFDTFEQYTAEDVTAGHFVDLDEANTFLRYATRTIEDPTTVRRVNKIADLTPVKAQNSEAVLRIYNANYVKTNSMNVEADVKDALYATHSSFLGFKFPKLDFTEEGLEVDEQGNPYIEFTLEEGYYVEIPYGPIFPIIAGKVKVEIPPVDWIQGSRLSGNDGMKGSYRDGSYFKGIKWSNFVHFEGLHTNTGSNDTHDYNYEKADLNTVLRAGIPDESGELKPTTDYKVVFEVTQADGTYNGQVPEIDPDTNLVTWHNDYYNHVVENAIDAELWNSVEVTARLQSADGTVTYKERIVTLLAEVPFNNPTADKKMFKVVKNETTRVNIGDLLHMINLVANDGSAVEEDMIYHSESINGSGRFYNRFTQELCYGLELTFDTDNIKVVNTDVETAGGKYELGGEYTIEEPMKDASTVLSKNAIFVLEPIDLTLQHPFEVRIPYTITGNFGYNYTAGEIVFYLYSDDADLDIPGVEDGETMDNED